ncbi:sulfotransferase [Marilutibacter maris]|uniref:sulfotransferase n=1 Tax=Marilutibacter maris TaxID=1605891 RepID=UPI000DAA87E2|nr:sulfotransferase [Lysobacter maris]
MAGLFVTGMIRSGTTLVQTLLTNHPDMFVAYQPFHQLYVEVKRRFLTGRGEARMLPLDDGSPLRDEERRAFVDWLKAYVFDADSAMDLARSANTGKGGGMTAGSFSADSGNFLSIWHQLHTAALERAGRQEVRLLGSKEVLCEEFVPAFLSAGQRCVLVLRDLRGVVASANNGRYRDLVGDRYPTMMLVRMWRKSAAYWLRYRHHPNVLALRYEDVASNPSEALQRITSWGGLAPYSESILCTELKDQFGRPWMGNSSFGDKQGVDAGAATAWNANLEVEEARFLAVVARRELVAAGYDVPADLGLGDILRYEDNTDGVRATYLEANRLDATCRELEVRRFDAAAGRVSDATDDALSDHFLFSDAYGVTD